MAIGITLNLSNSSFPPLPPTPPLPFWAPLRPTTSLKEPAIPLPQTHSSPFPNHYNTSFPRSFFLHILSFSPKRPHGRTQPVLQEDFTLMHLLKKTAGGRAGDRDQPAPSTRNLLGRVEVVACSPYSITSLEQGGFKQQILWIKR